MRSSVSYILSHAPGESVMSHPDYAQHAQHHACLLVLVKGIGGVLKNFNKLWERIQRVNNIKVTGMFEQIWKIPCKHKMVLCIYNTIYKVYMYINIQNYVLFFSLFDQHLCLQIQLVK